jgi:hypothetical protein
MAAQMPPLVDRDLFFGEVEIAGAQLSPDGQFISFLKPHKGTRNIWVKRAAEPFSAARPISAETKRPIQGYFWSRDSRFVLFAQDEGGAEARTIWVPKSGKQPVKLQANLPQMGGATLTAELLP